MTSALEGLAREILLRAGDAPRFFVAIVGPPASGKSTLAAALLAEVNRLRQGAAALVPMDGYHFDNAVLDDLGLRNRKGAPETFDVTGFLSDLRRIAANTGPVAVPVFDRVLDLSRGSARIIAQEHSVILVEGNYLLLDEAPWSSLADLFQYSVSLPVDEDILRERLVRRWLDHGLDHSDALERANANDLVNARRIVANSIHASMEWSGSVR